METALWGKVWARRSNEATHPERKKTVHSSFPIGLIYRGCSTPALPVAAAAQGRGEGLPQNHLDGAAQHSAATMSSRHMMDALRRLSHLGASASARQLPAAVCSALQAHAQGAGPSGNLGSSAGAAIYRVFSSEGKRLARRWLPNGCAGH